MSKGDAPPFYTRYGFERTGDVTAPLTIDPYPEICHAGALRATIFASAVDLVGSLHARDVAGRDAIFTSDLSLRVQTAPVGGQILARGETLRAGRRLVTIGVSLEIDGTEIAYGQTTFSRIPRPDSDPRDVADLRLPNTFERHPLERPLDREVGIEVTDPVGGRLEVELRDALRNPEGVMQGALVALLAETSACAASEHAFNRPQVVEALDLRYIAASRRGPIRARAYWIGNRATRMLRVELRDDGEAGRLTTTALVRVVDAPDA